MKVVNLTKHSNTVPNLYFDLKFKQCISWNADQRSQIYRKLRSAIIVKRPNKDHALTAILTAFFGSIVSGRLQSLYIERGATLYHQSARLFYRRANHG